MTLPTMVDMTATDCFGGERGVVSGVGWRSGTYTDGDILGRGEGPVECEADEGGVKTKLRSQLGEERIGHALRHDDEADRDA
jgi:hypothetical protein